MSKGIKKTGVKPEEIKPVEEMTGYELSRALDAQDTDLPQVGEVYDAEAATQANLEISNRVFTEEEQEALRISLRDSVAGKPVEDFGDVQGVIGETELDKNVDRDEQPGSSFEAEMDVRRLARIREQQAHELAARSQAFGDKPGITGIVSGLVPGVDSGQVDGDRYQGGLHHGYPPHSPGEGIQGGVSMHGNSVRKPTVGRIVLFASDSYPEPVPAIITRVHNSTLVDLTVFRPPMDPKEQQTTDDEGKRLGKPVSGYKVVQGVSGGIGRRWFWPEY